MSGELLPLFPLEVVLFPSMPLPLHIFEPRYKLMIRRCRERGEEFGVTLRRRAGVARVGCSAAIRQVVKQYDDGRMDILTVGRRRFRLAELFEELPYLQASVEYWPDEEEAGGEPAAWARLLKAYKEVFRLLHGRPHRFEASGSLVSFAIAAALPLELEYKQQLLELTSEAARQQSLLEQLESWLPQLRRLARVRKKAGGNGYGR